MIKYIEHLRGGDVIRYGSKTACIKGKSSPEAEKLRVTSLWKYNVTGNYRMLLAHFEPLLPCRIDLFGDLVVPDRLGCDRKMNEKKERIVLYWIGRHIDYDKVIAAIGCNRKIKKKKAADGKAGGRAGKAGQERTKGPARGRRGTPRERRGTPRRPGMS